MAQGKHNKNIQLTIAMLPHPGERCLVKAFKHSNYEPATVFLYNDWPWFLFNDGGQMHCDAVQDWYFK